MTVGMVAGTKNQEDIASSAKEGWLVQRGWEGGGEVAGWMYEGEQGVRM